MPPPQVIVVGGGLAGMAAGVALAAGGVGVTLLESARRLGGRASSFDADDGEQLDNCQHVLLGCCTNLLDFYRRIDASHLIEFHKTVYFRDGAGGRHTLRAMPGVPAPLHLSASFATFGALSLKERAAYAHAMLAMLQLGKDGRSRLADVSFGDWLDQHHQPASLVSRMYDPVLVGALNEDCRRASAAYAIQVFQDTMLANARGYVIGVPSCPLGQLYDRFTTHADGIHLRLGARVESLRFQGNRIVGVALGDGEILAADAVVLATNHHAVQRWVPAELARTDSRFAGLAELESVPILGAHLWFDRPVLPDPHAALITGPLQWLFRKDAAGAAVHGVISAARAWVGVPKEQALAQFETQVRSVLPGAKDAKLVRGLIVIEKRATFAPLPGVDRLRPPQGPPPGGIAGLYLAGDYTTTGWPATMEGAVRGGYLAAERLLEDAGQPQSFLQDDLPVQWPARLLGL